MTKAIDCLVNVSMGDMKQPGVDDPREGGLLQGAATPSSRARSCPSCSTTWTPTVSSGRSCSRARDGEPDRAQRFVEARPDRFALGVGGFNLLRPMPTLRDLESFVRDHPVAYARSDRASGATACTRRATRSTTRSTRSAASSTSPLCMNTGIPGPPIPGEAQNPIHLDRVCVRFPELKLCMIHGADPWWDTAIRLMIKYKNLRLMTSAWSPKYLPESLLHYMRDARQEPHPLRVGLPRAVDGALPRRSRRARPARRGPQRLALRQRRRVLLRSERMTAVHSMT